MLFYKRGMFKAFSGFAAFSFLGNNFLHAEGQPSASGKFVEKQHSSQKLRNIKTKNSIWSFLICGEIYDKVKSPLILPSLITFPPTLLALVYFYWYNDRKNSSSDVNKAEVKIANTQTKKEGDNNETVSKNIGSNEKTEINNKILKKDVEIKGENESSSSMKDSGKGKNVEKNAGPSEKETHENARRETKKENKLPAPKKDDSLKIQENKLSYGETNDNEEYDNWIYACILLSIPVFCIICCTLNCGKKPREKSVLDNGRLLIKTKYGECIDLTEIKSLSNEKLNNIFSNVNNSKVCISNEEGSYVQGSNLFIREEDIKEQKAIWDSIQQSNNTVNHNKNQLGTTSSGGASTLDINNDKMPKENNLDDFNKHFTLIEQQIENQKKDNRNKKNNRLQVGDVLPVLFFSGNNCAILSAFYLLYSPEYKVMYPIISDMKKETLLKALEIVMEDVLEKKPFLAEEYERFKKLDKNEKEKILDFHIEKLKHMVNFPKPEKEDEVEGKGYSQIAKRFENRVLGVLKVQKKDEKIGFGEARYRRVIAPTDVLMCFGFATNNFGGELIGKYEVEEYKDICIGDFFTNSKFLKLSWGRTTDASLPGEKEEEPSLILTDTSNKKNREDNKSDILLRLDDSFFDGALPKTGYSSIVEKTVEMKEIKEYISTDYLSNGKLDVEKIYRKFLVDEEVYCMKKVMDNIPAKISSSRRAIITKMDEIYGTLKIKEEMDPKEDLTNVAYNKFIRTTTSGCFVKGLDFNYGAIEDDRTIEQFLTLLLNKMLAKVAEMGVSDKEGFSEEEKKRLINEAVEDLKQKLFNNASDPKLLEKVGRTKEILENIFSGIRDKIVNKYEPPTITQPELKKNPKLKQTNNRYKPEFIHAKYDEELQRLRKLYGEEEAKEDIEKNGYLPLSIIKDAMRGKLNEDNKELNLKAEDDKKLWEDDTVLRLEQKYVEQNEGLPFFGNKVLQKVRENKDKEKFNSGYGNEAMYVAAICVHNGSSNRGGHWTCYQPKYKWSAEKGEYVISKWVLLDCEGHGPVIKSNAQVSSDLKHLFSQRAVGGYEIEDYKDSMVRSLTKEEIEAFPDYYIMDENGNMGGDENLRPGAKNEGSVIPRNWLEALIKATEAKPDEFLEKKATNHQETEEKEAIDDKDKLHGNNMMGGSVEFEINTSDI